MTALLQPPPVLAVLFCGAVVAAALAWGFHIRSWRDLSARLLSRGESTGAVAREDLEVWGTPDPLPPVARIYSYDRFVQPDATQDTLPTVQPEEHLPPSMPEEFPTPTVTHVVAEVPVAEVPVANEPVPVLTLAEEPVAELPLSDPRGAEAPAAEQLPTNETVREQPPTEQPPADREISLAEIFARAQRRRDQQ